MQTDIFNKFTSGDLQMFPNPAHHNVQIILPYMIIEHNEIIVELFDPRGTLVYSVHQEIDGNLIKLNITDLKPGNYRISLKTRILKQFGDLKIA